MKTSRGCLRWGLGWVLGISLGYSLLLPWAGVSVAAKDTPKAVDKKGAFTRQARSRQAVRSADAPSKDQRPLVADAPILKSYPVPGGAAESVAKILQEVYGNASKVRIAAIGSDKILVYGVSEHHFEIAKHLSIPSASPVTERIVLTTLEAGRVADMLKTMFSADPKNAPYVERYPDSNALIVRGSDEQVQEIKRILHALGEGDEKTANLRIITVQGSSAGALAEALQNTLKQMRPNPVKVIVPSLTDIASQADARPKTDAKPKDAKPEKAELPITLTVIGNRLLIATEDPQALRDAELIARLLQTATGEGDFEVIRLKHAHAADTARILNEAFNGPPPSSSGASSGPMRGVARPERIRIVADPGSNLLLIKASPLDLLTIRNLLRNALDVAAADAKPVTRTWIIPLKYVKALEAATAIKEIYRKGPLSVSADERSNSLILVGSEALFKEIGVLLNHLDEAARNKAPEGSNGPKKDK